MKTYYPMATYDEQIDNFHTLTTYDSLWYPRDCLEVFEKWISAGYKIDRMWIQVYEHQQIIDEISVVISNGHPVLVKKWS